MPTLDEQLREGRLFRLTLEWRRVMDKARRDVDAMLARTKSPYVALSWGKQSIVMAHLVFCASPSTLCVHWTGPDAELIADFSSVAIAFREKWPINYSEVQRGDKLADAIAEFDSSGAHDGVFVGLSAFESRARRITVRRSDHNNIMRYANGRLRCCPLAQWQLIELAAYIDLHGIPLLSTYRRYGLDVRTSTGCREGGRTEGGIDLMNTANAAEMRRRWKERT